MIFMQNTRYIQILQRSAPPTQYPLLSFYGIFPFSVYVMHLINVWGVFHYPGKLSPRPAFTRGIQLPPAPILASIHVCQCGKTAQGPWRPGLADPGRGGRQQVSQGLWLCLLQIASSFLHQLFSLSWWLLEIYQCQCSGPRNTRVRMYQ